MREEHFGTFIISMLLYNTERNQIGAIVGGVVGGVVLILLIIGGIIVGVCVCAAKNLYVRSPTGATQSAYVPAPTHLPEGLDTKLEGTIISHVTTPAS